MPIRLNLLSEAQAAEEARRRDPVKRAILGGVVVVGLVLGWSSLLQVRAMRVNSEFAGLKAKWDALEREHKSTLESRRRAIEAEDHLVLLQRYTTNRFLWGSTLNQMQHLLDGTDGISITRLRGEQSFLQVAEVRVKPGATGSAAQVKSSPASATERTVLVVDARDGSSTPGDQVAKLKAFLASPQSPGFTNAATATNLVALLSISAPQTEKNEKDAAGAGGSPNPYVTLTLQSTYPEKTRQ